MTLPPAAGPSHTSAGHTASHWMTREQEAIWINDTLTGGRSCYTVLWEHRLRGAVAPDAFEGALLDVIGRHEFLRSRFLMEDGVPVQCVTVTSGRPVIRECVTEADLGERLAALAAERLDPADGPLRPTLPRLSDDDWVLAVLAVQLHHLIIDWPCWSGSSAAAAWPGGSRTSALRRLRRRCSSAPTRTPSARPR
ncbi:condensation domain-containing protein [Streptomyces anulatus]|uniref:condensation domain-containing protein n=2 Tax=Streptomyces anulatus TaxID=1892 RepID=UPI00325212E8